MRLHSQAYPAYVQERRNFAQQGFGCHHTRGLEKFFLEAGEPATEGSSPPEGEPDVERIVEIGQKYGLAIPPPPGQ